MKRRNEVKAKIGSAIVLLLVLYAWERLQYLAQPLVPSTDPAGAATF